MRRDLRGLGELDLTLTTLQIPFHVKDPFIERKQILSLSVVFLRLRSLKGTTGGELLPLPRRLHLGPSPQAARQLPAISRLISRSSEVNRTLSSFQPQIIAHF